MTKFLTLRNLFQSNLQILPVQEEQHCPSSTKPCSHVLGHCLLRRQLTSDPLQKHSSHWSLVNQTSPLSYCLPSWTHSEKMLQNITEIPKKCQTLQACKTGTNIEEYESTKFVITCSMPFYQSSWFPTSIQIPISWKPNAWYCD